jgi:hypothetical protein
VEREIPEDLIPLAKQKKIELMGSLAEVDPEIEEYFLNEDTDIPVEVLKKSIRINTIN